MKNRKNILITGASGDIGLATVKQFLQEGHFVFAISRNPESFLERLDMQTEQVLALPIDFNDDNSMLNIEVAIAKSGRKLDVVIHNAGKLVNKPLKNITRSDIELSYQANVIGPMLLTKLIIPHFSQETHVVAISSMGGFQGSQKFPGLSSYSPSKAAICCLMECLQEEYRDTNWGFNSLCLGAVNTKMLHEAFPGYQALCSPEQMARYICQFSITGGGYFKGKTLPVSATNP